MKKHPEDASDWSEYVNNRDEWAVPDYPSSPNPHSPREGDALTGGDDGDDSRSAKNRGADGAVGPYGASKSPWENYDDRDPQPPRESTPYDETSPWTNHAAWRYQQNPYRGGTEETRQGCSGVMFAGIGLGIALIVIALILL